MEPEKDILSTVLDLLDLLVELLLTSLGKVILQFHEAICYDTLKPLLRQTLVHLPKSVNVYFISYARIVLIIPMLLLLASKHSILPLSIVILVEFGQFLTQVLVDQGLHKFDKEEAGGEEQEITGQTAADNDSFEVVTTGTCQVVPSWLTLQRSLTYSDFLRDLSFWIFHIPCWLALLPMVPAGRHLVLLQCTGLLGLSVMEMVSASLFLRIYITHGSTCEPTTQGLDLVRSVMTTTELTNAKLTLEVIGTVCFMCPVTRYVGSLLLALALPLSYECVRRKLKGRIIYVFWPETAPFDSELIRFWMQAKLLGTALVVGIPGEKRTGPVSNACSLPFVDQVFANAPAKADLMFLETHRIDYIIMDAGQDHCFVTNEVINAKRCLALGAGGVARLITLEGGHAHKE